MEPNITQSLPGPSDLLTEAWKVYQLKWKYLVKIILVSFIPGAVFGVLSLVLGIIVAIGYLKIDSASKVDPAAAANLIHAIISPAGLVIWMIFVALVLGFVVFQSWSQVALLIAVISEEVLSVKETYRRAWQKFASYFWVALILGLVVFTGYILFVIPGIILSVSLSMAGFVVLIDNVSGFSALARSRAYVAGHGWQVFGRLAMIVLISFVYELLATYLGKLSPGFSLLTTLVSVFVVSPIFLIYSFLIFKHLKAINKVVTQGSTVLYKIFTLLPLIFLALSVYFGWQILTSQEFQKTLQQEMNKTSKPNYSAGAPSLIN